MEISYQMDFKEFTAKGNKKQWHSKMSPDEYQ